MKTTLLLFSLIVISVDLQLADAQSSCLELLNNSTTRPKNGVYTLYDSNNVPYLAYCDMITDFGGWTLIASIHENNIETNGYCTAGDRWSSEQGNSALRPEGDGNWANRNTFGNVVSATSDDYKNQGYFDIDASDLMIWQVPNETPLEDWRSMAYLRYRTENNFLQSFVGKGNLQSLFKTFPLKSGVYSWPSDNGPSFPVVFDEGSVYDVVQHFGPKAEKYLTPGYVQFRAINDHRDAYALCPGVKISDDLYAPQKTCIGSTGDNTQRYDCGDFSGMAEYGVGSGVNWSVDKLLIETTFMLFYR